jgi:hypothetical protein
VSLLPFDVKETSLLDDPIRGVIRLHPDSRGLLEEICAFAAMSKWPRPMVTCFGRTRDDQEAIYLPTFLQQLSHRGVSDSIALSTAKMAARNRFSWHCIARDPDTFSDGYFRAFDLRATNFLEGQRIAIMDEMHRRHGTKIECLAHKVVGGAFHWHLAFKDPTGKIPRDWL